MCSIVASLLAGQLLALSHLLLPRRLDALEGYVQPQLAGSGEATGARLNVQPVVGAVLCLHVVQIHHGLAYGVVAGHRVPVKDLEEQVGVVGVGQNHVELLVEVRAEGLFRCLGLSHLVRLERLAFGAADYDVRVGRGGGLGEHAATKR